MSNSEKNRIAEKKRKFFTDSGTTLNMPDLIEVQKTSYNWFLKEGLKELFEEVSPIRDFIGRDLELYFLNYYLDEELTAIVKRSAQILNVEIDPEGTFEIARRSRGTPRIANRLLKRVRDYAQVKADGKINLDVADQALKMLEVDQAGLDDMDKKILSYILNECDGGPVGINSLAVAVGEDGETIEEIYEPYLIQKGFLRRTQSGRVLTKQAYAHFHIEPGLKQKDLWTQ